MSDQTPRPDSSDQPKSPFPSRKDIHGSRIPSTASEPAPRDLNTEAKRDQPHQEQKPLRQSLRRTTQLPEPVIDRPVAPATPVTVQQPSQGFVASQYEPAPNTAELRSIAEHKAKWRRRRKAVQTSLILLVLLGLVGGTAWWALNSLRGGTPTVNESNDYPGPGTGSVEVTVEPGDLGTDIGTHLFEAGVVKSVEAFVVAFDNNSASSTIRPGTYTMRLEMSAAGALAALLDEANRQDNTVTVNAGQTVSQVKERLIPVGGFTEEEVDGAIEDTAALGLPALADGNLEGWLAAGSYELSSSTTPVAILAQMVERTVTLLDELGVPEDARQELLIKASILEREVVFHEDMPKVARVIQNRLEDVDAETVGLLQMDSTVLYGLGKYGGIPTAEDLQTDTPFNTYMHKGLPPTPIATPSREAIEATLNPAEGDWLYFVTVDLDTGETLFSSTLAEQEENKLLLDQWCEANEGRC